MADLANCVRCGKVFVKQIRDVCRDCYKEEEAAFQIVYDFLRKQINREATLIEVVEATGVDEALITKFIKENRLRTTMFPKLGYPCEKCRTPITSGKLCMNCAEELKHDLDRVEQLEKITERNKLLSDDKKQIYYTIDKHRR
ncbi:TIGR03826 family flagellar region protein [Ornithinibacillus contaminans]|uniref:TIGR03826 family flagellar region protein n=1 Tax=Ornithinibacillus contaminans TaxID=694055 RepID=UPI00064D8F33|nr:TIGR03826 family flagellar region protein [Ornithinibacillus contaminans]